VFCRHRLAPADALEDARVVILAGAVDDVVMPGPGLAGGEAAGAVDGGKGLDVGDADIGEPGAQGGEAGEGLGIGIGHRILHALLHVIAQHREAEAGQRQGSVLGGVVGDDAIDDLAAGDAAGDGADGIE